MRLIDHYKADIARSRGLDKVETRARWHKACKRFLSLLSITSDRVEPYPEVRDATAKSSTISQHFGQHYIDYLCQPVDSDHTIANWKFFLQFSVEDLAAVYRASKPNRK